MFKLSAVLVALAMMSPVPALAASDDQADVSIEVTAPRNILATDGWTRVAATVRNTGELPASDVRFTYTIPQELLPSGTETSSEWDCQHGWRTVTCTHDGDLAPGATAYPFYFTASAQGATVGQTITAVADVTTASPEHSAANNHGSRDIQFVGKGNVRGRLWHDLNANGAREEGEPPVDSVGLSVLAVDDEDQYGYANHHGGTFDHRVPAKRFYGRVTLASWSGWAFTTPNAGDDTTDSDFVQVSDNHGYLEGRTDVFTVEPDGSVTIDVGLVTRS
ncbi:hypothetical protein FKR81_28020 [Lentzea tibetensis]|uniref:DUF11 domain-containing protein n=1 Tax=Lentzea tibetensis TaxID=2591470 RepID=A0A563EMS1_9PSEU|nr:DUF11 domain-containing protein [Lentzea tibetensis]TWP48442.1 hypothetical protein FKR81_28020 [Lentzea tibetensis]